MDHDDDDDNLDSSVGRPLVDGAAVGQTTGGTETKEKKATTTTVMPGGLVVDLVSQPMRTQSMSNAANCNIERGRSPVQIPFLFVVKLHELLRDCDRDNDGKSAILSWLPHGKSFKVHKPKEIVETILPSYFNQTKYKSFQRQLNLWGFDRITKAGPDKGAYFHEHFQRDQPLVVEKLRRVRAIPKVPAKERRRLAALAIPLQQQTHPQPQGTFTDTAKRNASERKQPPPMLQSYQQSTQNQVPSSLPIQAMHTEAKPEIQHSHWDHIQRFPRVSPATWRHHQNIHQMTPATTTRWSTSSQVENTTLQPSSTNPTTPTNDSIDDDGIDTLLDVAQALRQMSSSVPGNVSASIKKEKKEGIQDAPSR